MFPLRPLRSALSLGVLLVLGLLGSSAALAGDPKADDSPSGRSRQFALLSAPVGLSGTLITDDGSREEASIATQLDAILSWRRGARLDAGVALGLSQELKGDRPSLLRAYGYLRPFLTRADGSELGLRVLLGVATGIIASRDATLGPGPFAGLVLDHRMAIRPGLWLDVAFEWSLAVTFYSAPNPGYIKGTAASFTATPKIGLTWD